VILKNSTNINKTSNHLNSLNIKKDFGIPGPGLGQAYICGWVKGIFPFDNWISSSNAHKQKILKNLPIHLHSKDHKLSQK